MAGGAGDEGYEGTVAGVPVMEVAAFVRESCVGGFEVHVGDLRSVFVYLFL